MTGRQGDKEPTTWVFEGRTWRDLHTRPATIESFYASAFDENTGRTIVHGGEGAKDARLTDTWAWDGTTWTQVSANGPGPFDFSAMAHDKRRRVTVLFGMRPSGGPLEVWELRGNWVKAR